MDIHKPKPWRGGRELLKEIGTIVIGVLIALGAEQGVEWLHWRHVVQQERDAVSINVREQIEAFASRQAQQPCVERRLNELGVLFRKHKAGGSPHLLGPVGRPQNRGVGAEPWEVAVASQAVDHMSLSERNDLAGAYSNFENLRQLLADADRSWIPLSELDRANDLDAADWVELRRAYTQVIAIEDRIGTVTPYVLKTQNLGVTPPTVPLADALHDEYSKALCRPLLAP